ncbi:MAG: hypothetical protein HY877_02915 [Deltaproteobacteria bacterium]|nr:hypothetical protein [Deltaproteobacteria bacterium]
MQSGGQTRTTKVNEAKIRERAENEFLLPKAKVDEIAPKVVHQIQVACDLYYGDPANPIDAAVGANSGSYQPAKQDACEDMLGGDLRVAADYKSIWSGQDLHELTDAVAGGDFFLQTPPTLGKGANINDLWHYFDLIRGAASPSDATPAEAPAGKSPLELKLKKLQMHTPAPWDKAASEGATEEMKKGTFILDAEGAYSLVNRPSYAVGVVGTLEHKAAAGFDPDSVISATKRGLSGRKLETEGGVGLSLTLPINGSNDMEVPPMDLVSASSLAKELTEKAKARWGDKAAQIYLDVVRAIFENADEDQFSGDWNGLTTKAAQRFESLLSDSNLPKKENAKAFVPFFALQPSALIDLIALWSGKSVSEIKTELNSKGVDLAKFEASKNLALDYAGIDERIKLFGDLLEKAGTLGLTKKFELSKDYDDHAAVSTIKLPTNPAKLKTALGLDGYAKALEEKEKEIAKALGTTPAELKKAAEDAKEEYPFVLVPGKNDQDNPWRVDARVNSFRNKKLGEKIATISAEVAAKLKSDWTLNPYPVLEPSILFSLYKSDEGILRGATLILAGEYDGPAFTAKPEDAAHVFVGVAILQLKLEQWTKWNADFRWIGIGLKPKDGDFTPVKNIFAGKLRADLSRGFYSEGSVTRIFQGDTTQQTSPNGLNDGTSGGGNGEFTTEVGRNETIYSLELGYKISPITLGAVYTHMISSDVLTGEGTSRDFIGAAFTAKF